MKTKKFRVLKIAAIICFIYAVVEIGIGIYTIVSSDTDDKIITLWATIEEDEGKGKEELIEQINNNETIQIGEERVSKSDVLTVIKIVFSMIYFVQALFFIVEGLLISRAILKGKTTLIIVFLLLGFILPLLTLIHSARTATYNIDSASNLVSIIIKTIILKQVFEIRRLNMDV